VLLLTCDKKFPFKCTLYVLPNLDILQKSQDLLTRSIVLHPSIGPEKVVCGFES